MKIFSLLTKPTRLIVFSGTDSSSNAVPATHQKLLFVILATVIPLIIILSLEVWMVSAYTGGFEITPFTDQYGNGIYRYRILGREILLGLYRYLSNHFVDHTYPLPRSPHGSFLFYASFSITNGLYLVASNFILLVLLWRKSVGFSESSLLNYFFYTLVLSLSMAVVTPYDQLAYLLILLGFLGFSLKSETLGIGLLAISVIAGAINRETEFLLLPSLAVLSIYAFRHESKRSWRLTAAAGGLFFGIYLALRVILPGQAKIIQSVTMGGKWGVASLLVFSSLCVMQGLLVFRMYPDLKPFIAILFLSSPYLVTILAGGALRELRLCVPLLLCITCVYSILGHSGGLTSTSCDTTSADQLGPVSLC